MSITSMHDGRVVLHQNDCRDVLRGLADSSIDSVVTDPPYALVSIQKRFGKPGSVPAKDVYGRGAAGFMGKQWDTGEVAFSEEFWAEVLRVLKPGGHVVAFSGTRTYHRMAVAIEDAGLEIRDQLGWVFGSGFPKSHNQHGDWEGWGTALKPAWEPIALVRKPLTGTVAANLAEWGVGAINVDGCRVETDEELRDGAGKLWSHYREGEPSASRIYTDVGGTSFSLVPGIRGGDPRGRWPANLIHDGSEEVLSAFPDAKGQQGYVGPKHGERPSKGIYGDFGARPDSHPRVEAETSAARFFYCAKASRADRDAGLDHLPKKAGGMVSNTSGQHMTRRDEGYKPEPRANTHPTVKPTTLMQWLCRLITPPGGVILDPFMGSGSTGKAAVLEGFQFIGCEREDEYMPIATARIAWAIGVVSKDDELAAVPVNDNRPADLFSKAA
ncbi:site-specific DNA-methyltransferase [Agrobacterium sp. 10MFCol1.1]|uniref:DNA-methyltransferase n=1 Tax=Agrobacterium sp. 10MFCol1.1 TaxID=1150775 RepID=UPI0018C92642|nr:site-specific DNA-methyltransferase [Agrobacterium sp. 10MFCol1.1]